ncbi:class Ib ribonucleoside-diphosphate reductase assembly flavoprotein NrdI [Faecalicoccus acidiformans]|uniref:class Ib ribonucleoside-diphosphate reductase assembly flavoprotein NrdI n=1 Tax=Faecalicoccus acidiformans TaxID=915173 RepID=UPI0025A370CE|nr:class Ib ribonucleoside-diphosphate reductase assembly flavoprotein NrdI [Faecalicoccus acidiformans]MDM8203677.1 class Ib ribonucleoside-diphosphate reductase assembly flavoprotein NrdI [Faecalicoccus acidiformans]
MNYAYASRTGNVESIIQQLGLDATFIQSGDETIDGPFILFTYTDGLGDVPMEVETFLMANGAHLKGVIVSGDTGYGDAYCQAGDKIAAEYDVECLYKVENAGEPNDIEAISKILENV